MANGSVVYIVTDHERRVRFRNMAEKSGLTVFSAADGIEGMSLLQKLKSPAFLLLSSEPMPLMSYDEFLIYKGRHPELAKIPVILISTKPILPLPNGVAYEIVAPISQVDLNGLIKKYCL
jgi:hypothetical protein